MWVSSISQGRGYGGLCILIASHWPWWTTLAGRKALDCDDRSGTGWGLPFSKELSGERLCWGHRWGGQGEKSLSLHCEEGILYAKPGLSVTSPFLFLPLNIGDEPIPWCGPKGSAHWGPWETARNLPQLFHLKEQAVGWSSASPSLVNGCCGVGEGVLRPGASSCSTWNGQIKFIQS